MRAIRLLICVLCALVLGCGSAPGPYERAKRGSFGFDIASEESDSDDAADAPGDYATATGGAMRGEPPMAMPAPAPPPPSAQVPKVPAGPSTAPLLIYMAEYGLRVVSVPQTLDAVQSLATGMGGYLVERRDARIVVRVPAAKYRDALSDVAKLGDVTSHQESVEDVTEQFNDLAARLANLKTVRTRLQELLAAAKGVTETLAVERELERVSSEIEVMEAKLKRMSELIHFSTITVNCTAKVDELVTSRVDLPFPWLNQLGLGSLLRLE
jgi:hypothetical protein